jgi:hypothetical protein
VPVEQNGGDRPRVDRKTKILFLHIPKTAGMSLNGLLVRNYRGRKQFNAEIVNTTSEAWQQCLDRLRKSTPDELEQVAVFKGHFIFGLHELIPGPSTYITFLRDPVKRLISHYNMIKRGEGIPADHQLDPSRADWNLGAWPDFLRTVDNYQTRAISGRDFDVPFGACNQEHLALAKEHLDRHFAFVGSTEQFDMSLIALRRTLGWKMRFYVPDNVAPDRSPTPAPEVIEALRRLNSLDAELYRYGSERLAKLIESSGWNLRAEVGLYRAGNRLHRQLHHWRHQVKRRLGLERRPEIGPG